MPGIVAQQVRIMLKPTYCPSKPGERRECFSRDWSDEVYTVELLKGDTGWSIRIEKADGSPHGKTLLNDGVESVNAARKLVIACLNADCGENRYY